MGMRLAWVAEQYCCLPNIKFLYNLLTKHSLLNTITWHNVDTKTLFFIVLRVVSWISFYNNMY